MNNREQAVAKIEAALQSHDKCLLMAGTNQYNKHKLIMQVLDSWLENHLILFRTNGLKNVTNYDHLGWVGMRRKLKAGERVKIGRNVYEFDTLVAFNTWTPNSFGSFLKEIHLLSTADGEPLIRCESIVCCHCFEVRLSSANLATLDED